MLSYSSVHCLDQSGNTVIGSAHLLHLLTVAHLVQILLTSTTGDTDTHMHTHAAGTQTKYFLIHPCVCVDEVCMDQDGIGSEEEELTSQLYNTLRKHLGGSVCTRAHTHTHTLVII